MPLSYNIIVCVGGKKNAIVVIHDCKVKSSRSTCIKFEPMDRNLHCSRRYPPPDVKKNSSLVKAYGHRYLIYADFEY